jgi:glycosyltransferase involved in cell wall biosynthesis
LKSLGQQTDRNFQVLLVNNGDRDLASLPETRSLSLSIQEDRTPNLPHLFNEGFRFVNSDIVAYLNDDTEVNPNWIEEIRRSFLEYPDAIIVGGPALDEQRKFTIT